MYGSLHMKHYYDYIMIQISLSQSRKGDCLNTTRDQTTSSLIVTLPDLPNDWINDIDLVIDKIGRKRLLKKRQID